MKELKDEGLAKLIMKNDRVQDWNSKCTAGRVFNSPVLYDTRQYNGFFVHSPITYLKNNYLKPSTVKMPNDCNKLTET